MSVLPVKKFSMSLPLTVWQRLWVEVKREHRQATVSARVLELLQIGWVREKQLLEMDRATNAQKDNTHSH